MEEYDILKCVDRGLESLGSQVRQTVYWKISILYGSMHNTVVANPVVFENLLRETLGDSSIGAEKSIIHELAAVFELGQSDRQSLARALEVVREQIPPFCSPNMMVPDLLIKS